MRLVKFLLAAAVAVAVAAPAGAQTNGANGATTPDPAAAAAPVATPQAVNVGEIRSHWTASGFAGTNFRATGDARITDNRNPNFGGQVSYIWSGIIGAEVLADWSPKFDVTTIAFEDNPHVFTYMGNAIAAIPLGDKGQFQPYGSGGVGAVHIVANVFDLTSATRGSTTRSSEARFGTNIGGGLMAFAGNVGIRADVRYYRTTTENNPDTTLPVGDQLTRQLLSGLAFWRTNIGVAFRW